MGNGEVDTPAKTAKSSSASHQEQPPNSPATVFPDWASYQAYFNSAGTPPIPPPGFFHSSVPSSPQTHPYVWGAQHMIPPYGTPPYVAMYPHGGIYAHPSMPPGSHPYGPYAMPSLNGTAEASAGVAGGADSEGKSAEGKNGSSLKKSKGSLGSLSMLTGKGNETEKASGVSANGTMSQSGESGNEGSSEGSDADSQNGSQQKLCGEKDPADADAQNGSTACSTPTGATRASPNMGSHSLATMTMPGGVSGPTTNLNIGMDYWGGHAPTSMAAMRAKVPAVPATGPIVPGNPMAPRDGVPPELWLQDERELKRQRRKQSNRESARRSRLRKQAECEELAQRVETLKEENNSLREDLEHMRSECEKLAAENASLTERLEKHKQQEPAADDSHGQPDRKFLDDQA